MTAINYKDLNMSIKENQEEVEHLIAKKLGWTHLKFVPECYGIPPNEQNKQRVPSYCTDLNDAIQLEHDGWLLSLKHWTRAGSKNEWLAQYYNNQQARGIGRWHESPATAICLAWLEVADAQ